MLTDINRNK